MLKRQIISLSINSDVLKNNTAISPRANTTAENKRVIILLRFDIIFQHNERFSFIFNAFIDNRGPHSKPWGMPQHNYIAFQNEVSLSS